MVNGEKRERERERERDDASFTFTFSFLFFLYFRPSAARGFTNRLFHFFLELCWQCLKSVSRSEFDLTSS